RAAVVQVADRVARLGAEAAQVGEHGGDLRVAEGVAEGRHLVRQAEEGPAVAHEAGPVGGRLGGRDGAVGEVGERYGGAARAARAAAVGAVAGGARLGVD